MILSILMISLSCFFSYIFGSFNFAIFISRKFYKKNIKKLGSKNAGMTNVFRNFGVFPALVTLFGDMFKGFLSIFICHMLCFKFLDENMLVYAKYIALIFALIGHIFPIFYNFSGGKGVSVVAGSMLFIDAIVFLAVFVVFFVIFKISKIVSLSSICAALLYPIETFFICFFRNITTVDLINRTIFTTVISIILIFAHRDNIKRLLERKEPKIRR